MNNIPPKLRLELSKDPEYQTCLRQKVFKDHTCQPDSLSNKLIEWEHVIYFKGKQLQKKWAIIPICYLVHRGGMLDKQKNEYIALHRATDQELEEISKVKDWKHYKNYLKLLYERK